ncbi:MAG: hypothetical protein ACREH4_07325 [Vitreimonas sp.]
MKTLLALSALGLVALLGACEHSVDTAGVPSFGASVEAMHNAQTIPGETTEAPPEGSGAAGVLAQSRYQNGRTRALTPSPISSSTTSSN